MVCFLYTLYYTRFPASKQGIRLPILAAHSFSTFITTDTGTEELAHMEIVSTIIYQLTRNLTPEQVKAQGFDTYFVDHTTGVYPQAASGMPFSTSTLQVTGDALADLFEDMAADAAII